MRSPPPPPTHGLIFLLSVLFLPRAHVLKGYSNRFRLTKIARSEVLDTCCKHNESVGNGKKLASIHFELLKWVANATNRAFLFDMSVVYRPHPLCWHVMMRQSMLEVSVGKGRQVTTLSAAECYATVLAAERAGYVL